MHYIPFLEGKCNHMKKKLFILLFLILCSISAIVPLFHPGFFQSDDGEWMVIRFSAFHQAFRDGQFPVRFLGRLNHGYGYPVANFLYPGFMYLAEPIKLLGFGFVNTIKILMGLSMIGSAVFTYLWLSSVLGFNKQRTGNWPAFIGALVYLYTPYHLYDLYTRGSVGELLALAVVPFVLWQVERKSFFWSASGIAFLILSHNTLAVLFLPIILLYMFIRVIGINTPKKVYYKYIGIFITSLGLSAFFWIPAVFELGYTKFSSTSVADVSKYFAEVSLIGIGNIILAGLGLYCLSQQRKDTKENRLLVMFGAISLLSIFYSSLYSSSIWEILPTSFIQFPFRVLSILILSSSYLVAYVLSSGNWGDKGDPRLVFRNVLLLTILFLSFGYSVTPYISPREYFDKGEGFYATNEDSTTVKNEYMPRWVKEEPTEHFEKKVEGVETGDVVYNSKNISFIAKSSGTASIRTIYFPGWRAYVDGKEAKIDYSNAEGLMEVRIERSNSKVRLQFSETPLRLFADIASVTSLVGLLAITLYPRLRVRE
jgi:hypothetical protein